MPRDESDSAESWGSAARFMLGWALACYLGWPNGQPDADAGDRHLAIAITNVREAAHRANRILDAAV